MTISVCFLASAARLGSINTISTRMSSCQRPHILATCTTWWWAHVSWTRLHVKKHWSTKGQDRVSGWVELGWGGTGPRLDWRQPPTIIPWISGPSFLSKWVTLWLHQQISDHVIFFLSLSGLVVLTILLGTINLGHIFKLNIGVSRRAQGEVVISSFWKSDINCVRSDLAYHEQDDFPTSSKRFLTLLNADTNMLTNMRCTFPYCGLLRSMHVNSYHKFIDAFVPESVNFQRILDIPRTNSERTHPWGAQLA